MKITLDDWDALWRTVYGEARGEGLDGQIAVAHVILNRVKTDLGGDGRPDWWGEGIAGVCKARLQFSCWNKNDPNYVKLFSVHGGYPEAQSCIHAASGALIGRFPDPTGGATHYHSDSIHPGWAEGQSATAHIGRHLFYRL